MTIYFLNLIKPNALFFMIFINISYKQYFALDIFSVYLKTHLSDKYLEFQIILLT